MLDKSLLGKQGTANINLKAHVESFKQLSKEDKIRYDPNSLSKVSQDLDLEDTPDWGIINSDGSRVIEFVEYISINSELPFHIHYVFLDLIIASMNDSIVDNLCDNKVKDVFYNYVRPKLGTKKYYPYVTYWIGLSSDDEFPVGYLLSNYL